MMSGAVFVQVCPPHQWAHSPTVGCFTCMRCPERVNYDDPRYDELLKAQTPAFVVNQATGAIEPAGPITAEELMSRGVSDDVEGRALDVVLRCGWPRPGDPLGIRPAIPIGIFELKHVIEVASADDQRKPELKLEEIIDFLRGQLRHQEYVRTVVYAAVDGAGS